MPLNYSNATMHRRPRQRKTTLHFACLRQYIYAVCKRRVRDDENLRFTCIFLQYDLLTKLIVCNDDTVDFNWTQLCSVWENKSKYVLNLLLALPPLTKGNNYKLTAVCLQMSSEKTFKVLQLLWHTERIVPSFAVPQNENMTAACLWLKHSRVSGILILIK